MSALAYNFNILNFGIVKHLDQVLPLAHDLYEQQEVDVQVRSGDYFVQLATMLDLLLTLHQTDEISPALNRIIQDLLYLQAHYAIHKKP